MKPWLKLIMRDLFGSAKPTAPIRKNRASLSVETLENRLVPSAVTYTVNDISDVAHGNATGPLVSLRDAVTAANTDNAGDTIVLSPGIAGKTIKLNSVLTVAGTEKIDGTGRNVTLSGQGLTQIFKFDGAAGNLSFTLKGLTLTAGHYNVGGLEDDGGGAIGTVNCDAMDNLAIQSCNFNHNTTDSTGGAIADYGANLKIQDCVVTGNTSGNEGGGVLFHGYTNSTFLMERTIVSNNKVTNSEQGGGLCIEKSASAAVNNSVFSGNVSGGEGGAIAIRSGGTTTIQNSILTSNKASNNGGGIWSNNGTLVLKNSTISGNIVSGDGGGIFTNADLTASNTTISGNTAHNGGGIENKYTTITLKNCTVAFNKATNQGGGVDNSVNASLFLNNTIVSDNRNAGGLNDLFNGGGTINAQYSLIQTPSGSINGTNSHNIFFVSANLGPLKYNGGPAGMLTMAPSNTSKALRAGSIALLTPDMTTDQRGAPRTFVGTVDIGAVEASFDYRRGL